MVRNRFALLCLSTSTELASSLLVWTVAMFGLMSTTSMPSSLRALMAWEPAGARVATAAATASWRWRAPDTVSRPPPRHRRDARPRCRRDASESEGHGTPPQHRIVEFPRLADAQTAATHQQNSFQGRSIISINSGIQQRELGSRARGRGARTPQIKTPCQKARPPPRGGTAPRRRAWRHG